LEFLEEQSHSTVKEKSLNKGEGIYHRERKRKKLYRKWKRVPEIEVFGQEHHSSSDLVRGEAAV